VCVTRIPLGTGETQARLPNLRTTKLYERRALVSIVSSPPAFVNSGKYPPPRLKLLPGHGVKTTTKLPLPSAFACAANCASHLSTEVHRLEGRKLLVSNGVLSLKVMQDSAGAERMQSRISVRRAERYSKSVVTPIAVRAGSGGS